MSVAFLTVPKFRLILKYKALKLKRNIVKRLQ